MGESCICCGADATLLCDYVLGFEVGSLLPEPRIANDGEMFTCDAPLCARCAKHIGNRFFCGSAEVAGIESVDYCPAHADAPSREAEAMPITETDAEYLRRKVFAQLRRASIRRANPAGERAGE